MQMLGGRAQNLQSDKLKLRIELLICAYVLSVTIARRALGARRPPPRPNGASRSGSQRETKFTESLQNVMDYFLAPCDTFPWAGKMGLGGFLVFFV